MSSDSASAGGDDLRAELVKALTFHASFDHGPDADFALGDPTLYSASAAGALTVGLGDPPVIIAEGRGKFGSAIGWWCATRRGPATFGRRPTSWARSAS